VAAHQRGARKSATHNRRVMHAAYTYILSNDRATYKGEICCESDKTMKLTELMFVYLSLETLYNVNYK